MGTLRKKSSSVASLLSNLEGILEYDEAVDGKGAFCDPHKHLVAIANEVMKSHPGFAEGASKPEFGVWVWEYCFMHRVCRNKTGDVIKMLIGAKALTDSFGIVVNQVSKETVVEFFVWLRQKYGVKATKMDMTYFILGLSSAEIWASTLLWLKHNEKFNTKMYNSAYVSHVPWIAPKEKPAEIDKEAVKAEIGELYDEALKEAWVCIGNSKERVVTKVEKVNRTVEELRAKQEKLKGELSTAKSEVTALKRKQKSLQENFDKQGAQLTTCKEQLKALKDEQVKEVKEAEVIEDTTKIKELEAQLDEVRAELLGIEEERDKCKAESLEVKSQFRSLDNRANNLAYRNMTLTSVIQDILSNEAAIKSLPLQVIIKVLSEAKIAVYGVNLESILNTLRGAGLCNITWYSTAEMLDVVGKDCIVMCNDNSTLAKRIKEEGVKVVKFNPNQNSIDSLCRMICSEVGLQVFLNKGEVKS